MTVKKLTMRQKILVAGTLFGMFFGAGNLIFPVHLGQLAGRNVIPAIMGFIVWKLERKIAARDKRAEEQDEAQKDFFLLMVQSTGAAIALGEATAKAVQRIPDANCNGDMHDALNYAANIKHKQKDFLTKQGIHALYD